MQTKTKIETIKQRMFSVELHSKTYLNNLTLTKNPQENVLIEGSIGELTQASFDEDVILQVVGTKGTLRLDLAHSELKLTNKKE